MKYRINKSALIGLIFALVLFLIRIISVLLDNNSTTLTEINLPQQLFSGFLGSIAILLTLTISVIQAKQHFKQNIVSFWVDIGACSVCCGSFFAGYRLQLWHEYGTYIALFLVLVSLCIVPKASVGETESMGKEDKSATKIAAGILAAIILGVAIISFVKGSPQYVISNGMIYLFSLIIILLVWDSVESFSLSNIVTLTKRVKDKEKEVQLLSSENKELRANFLSIIQNKQIFNVEINNGKAQVEPAIQDDSNNADNDLEFDKVDTIIEIDPNDDRNVRRRAIMPELVSQKAMEKFADKNNISPKELQRNVKFSQSFIEKDPIMSRNAIFDAYIKRSLDEIFIEVKFPSMVIDERIYYMLSQINRYVNTNKVNAKLVIILPKFSKNGLEMVVGHAGRNQERLPSLMRSRYKQAIENGLLEIAEIEIADEEVAKMKTDLENE
ncbi:MAG: hypothetical protein IKJ99_07115 [Oscillospiraceae bacterium]|nr:hypothetical protein [Oscillospiraceae bacterium]